MRVSLMCNIWRCFRREWKWERSKIGGKLDNPGYILRIIRCVFKVCYMASISKWIAGKWKHHEMKRHGDMRPYIYVDRYVTGWFIFALAIFATFGILHSTGSSGNQVVFIIFTFLLSYRLFDIFQSWVDQFILTREWQPINVNRSLVLAIEGYLEIIIIGAILRLIFQPSPNFWQALQSSVFTMIANPDSKDTSVIQYTQIMFVILFVMVVIQHVVGRLSNKPR